jgi:hypothetical protein
MSSLILYFVVVNVFTAQTDQFSLANARTTYSPMGAVRTDEKILPGDQVVISFDIVGARVNAAGKVRYSMAMEVVDSRGRVLFKQRPRDMETPVPQGRSSLQACATLDVGMKQPPGEYTVKVIVKDLTGGATQEITRKYELLAKGFGLVRYSTTRDPDGRMPAAVFRLRTPGWINFTAVGAERDRATGQPDVAVQMRVLDKDGKAIMKPASGEVKEGIPQGHEACPMQFEVNLPAEGSYSVELTAIDKISGRKAALTVPLTVSAGN